MTKRLAIKVGEFQNNEGVTKGEYLKLGVILDSEHGEYVLLDPAINLAGALIKQRVMNSGKQNKGKGDMVLCNIFTDDNSQQNSAPRQQQSNSRPQQQARDSGASTNSGFDDFPDEPPF